MPTLFTDERESTVGQEGIFIGAVQGTLQGSEPPGAKETERFRWEAPHEETP